jgi:hypothetical protein
VHSARQRARKKPPIGGSVCSWPAWSQRSGLLATMGEGGSGEELSELGHVIGQVR